jgi:hypothetical protein
MHVYRFSLAELGICKKTDPIGSVVVSLNGEVGEGYSAANVGHQLLTDFNLYVVTNPNDVGHAQQLYEPRESSNGILLTGATAKTREYTLACSEAAVGTFASCLINWKDVVPEESCTKKIEIIERASGFGKYQLTLASVLDTTESK